MSLTPISNEALISSLYTSLILRDPTTEEISYLKEQLDVGLISPVGLVILDITEPDFTEVALPIAMMFEAVFGHYATTDELMTWRMVYDHGLTLNEMGQRFVLSNEFRINNSNLNTTADYLQALAQSGLGRDVSQDELDKYVPMLDAAEINYGDIVQLIIEVNSREADVGFAMLYGGLNDTEATSEIIDALDLSDIPAAINQVLDESPLFTLPVSSDLLSLTDDGQLLIAGELTADMTLNLNDLTVTVDTVTQSVINGSLADVTTVDATDLTGTGKVIFTGNSADESYKASGAGDTIRAAAGDDQLTGGDASDIFIFEAEATENGLDQINDFQITTPDILDFSAFLTVTGVNNIAVVDSESTEEIPWSNGDILVVEGYDLASEEAIANLFGPGASFAAPTARGKAVVIVTDIIGDASVWYLVNQVDTTTIAAEELTQVAILTGINNLTLLSFTADNFA